MNSNSWPPQLGGSSANQHRHPSDNQVTWAEVENYWNMPPNSLTVSTTPAVKELIESFNPNRYVAFEQYTQYIWDLVHQVQSIPVFIEEYDLTVKDFSKWLYENKYTPNASSFTNVYDRVSFLWLEYDMVAYLLNISLSRPGGMLHIGLRGFAHYLAEVSSRDYRTVAIRRGHHKKLIPYWKVPIYQARNWVVGEFILLDKDPYGHTNH